MVVYMTLYICHHGLPHQHQTTGFQSQLKVFFFYFCVDACNFCALLYYIVKTNRFEMRDKTLEREFICDYHDIFKISIYLYTLAVSPSLGGSRQHKRNKQKQWGFHSVLPAMTRDPAEFGWHCWSNTTHPPPSSTTYVAS